MLPQLGIKDVGNRQLKAQPLECEALVNFDRKKPVDDALVLLYKTPVEI